MAVTIRFNGVCFDRIFSNVDPPEIMIKNGVLIIRDVHIPVAQNRIFDLFYYLKKFMGRPMYGVIEIHFSMSGEISHWASVHYTKFDYILTKISDIGMKKEREILPRNYNRIPNNTYCEII